MPVRLFFSSLLLLLIASCDQGQQDTKDTPAATVLPSNMDEGRLSAMQWMNEPADYEIVEKALMISVQKDTDFFNNPEDNSVVGTAPLLYTETEGDFLARSLVKPDFNSQWNAVSLMVYQDSLHWIKFAFENSDATGPGIVSVVTKDRSDDANGAVLNDGEAIWLAIARKGNNYAMHWSKDGQNYTMARLSQMPAMDKVKVGIEAQSPVGDSATHQLLFFDLKPKTVKNLRDLNDED